MCDPIVCTAGKVERYDYDPDAFAFCRICYTCRETCDADGGYLRDDAIQSACFFLR